ncbi:hypothetical protein BDR04DRAFT_480998 [Suillus decipiens]|nr:hypothetical protein BDR04DRAFT_480998 [Suillus decipiens]
MLLIRGHGVGTTFRDPQHTSYWFESIFQPYSKLVPGHFGEYPSPPPLGEGPSHLERVQDPGQTNLTISEIYNNSGDPLLCHCSAISFRDRFRATHSTIPPERCQTAQDAPRIQERHISLAAEWNKLSGMSLPICAITVSPFSMC